MNGGGRYKRMPPSIRSGDPMNDVPVEHSLWPYPASVERQPGEWYLPPEITTSVEHPGIAEFDAIEALWFLRPIGPSLSEVSDVRVRRADLPAGAYRLTVDAERGVEIRIRDRPGLLAAATTLRQLLPDDAWRPTPVTRGTWFVPAVVVDDEPVHEWRGLMIDVARHFLPVNQVLRYIDLVAMHKLNVLHLHLTDNQGWRVESRCRPRLNEIASWRPETALGHPLEAIMSGASRLTFDGTPHGGLYTHADLAAIAAHGKVRGVTVVPEIDLPGHSAALLAAVPELASSVAPARSHPDAFTSLRPATISPLPSAMEVIGELLEEVASAVGGPYLHVGGDEADLSEWETAPEVIDYRKTLALSDVSALGQHVNQTLTSTVISLGRLPIFWDEAFAAGGLDERAFVMCWRGESIGLRAAAAGHKVIMAPVDPTYLDYAEVDDADEPVALGYGNDIARLAGWAPPGGGSSRILGCHAPIWTEAVPDGRLLDYRVFPRLCLLAQAAWSGRPSEWPGRRVALERHCGRLQAAGVEFRPLDGPHPWQRGGTGARRWAGGFSIETVGAFLAQQADEEL
jgi:hexosaminidase